MGYLSPLTLSTLGIFTEGEDFSDTMFMSDLARRDFDLMMQSAMRRVIHEAREAAREAARGG